MSHLGKCENLMRDDFEAGAIHLPGALYVLGLQLLKQGIVDPQVNISLPVSLLWGRWYVCNCSLVHLNVRSMLRMLADANREKHFINCSMQQA